MQRQRNFRRSWPTTWPTATRGSINWWKTSPLSPKASRIRYNHNIIISKASLVHKCGPVSLTQNLPHNTMHSIYTCLQLVLKLVPGTKLFQTILTKTVSNNFDLRPVLETVPYTAFKLIKKNSIHSKIK